MTGFRSIFVSSCLCCLLDSATMRRRVGGQTSFKNTIRGLGTSVMGTLSLPVPPLSIRHRVIHVLSGFAGLATRLATRLATEGARCNCCESGLLAPGSSIIIRALNGVYEFIQNPFNKTLGGRVFGPANCTICRRRRTVCHGLRFECCVSGGGCRRLGEFTIRPKRVVIDYSKAVKGAFIVPRGTPRNIVGRTLLGLAPADEVGIFCLRCFFSGAVSGVLGNITENNTVGGIPSIRRLGTVGVPVPALRMRRQLIRILSGFRGVYSSLGVNLPTRVRTQRGRCRCCQSGLLDFGRRRSKLSG